MTKAFWHPPADSSQQGRRYWRSLDELAQTPGFRAWMDREFPEGASTLEGVDRRAFLKLMAAGFAFAGVGMAGCRRPEALIVAYGRQPENVIPGLPTFYATAHPARRGAVPLVVETHEARPTKLEGNPSYALFGGATDLRTQGTLLDLYDPDRATRHTRDGGSLTQAQVQDVLNDLHDRYLETRGAGLAILAEPSTSPTRARLVARLLEVLPEVIYAEYDPTAAPGADRAASAAVDAPARFLPDLREAQVIVSIEDDFLVGQGHSLALARAFADGRRVARPGDAMNRLYVAESVFSVTGANSDHRLRIDASQAPAFALALAAAVLAKLGSGGALAAAISQAAGRASVGEAELWISACAEDLVAHRGRALLLAGGHLPPAVHAAVLAVNEALGGRGHTYTLVRLPQTAPTRSITELAGAIRAGRVRSLVILGGNPAYDAPAELNWPAVQASVPEVLRHGYYVDETSTGARIHLAATHYLESWGDARTFDGTLVPVQPMIQPLFEGIGENEILARLGGDGLSDDHALALETFRALHAAGRLPGANPDVTLAYRQFLHDGVAAGTAYPAVGAFRESQLLALIREGVTAPSSCSAQALDVRFVADTKMDDGRFANNGWLQECPEPMTKLTWDNAILISPRLGQELGVLPAPSTLQVAARASATFKRGKEQAPVCKLTLGGVTVEGPVHVQPGLADWTVVLPLGYGRRVTGRVGTGSGTDFYRLRAGGAWVASGAKLEVTPRSVQLANTQEHWSFEGRDIYREANLATFTREPDFARTMGIESHTPPILGSHASVPLAERARSTPRGNSLYETPDLDGTHQWGMSIDLNACIGCSACVVACQSENNIPYVGRDQVLRGREMHWIRLDRYYTSASGDPTEIPADPQVAIQPLACVHCENAPCENVCPVNATVHDNEGLNVMAYNRCIGTRYCANNCPYKVRRFNWFDFHQRQLDSLYRGPLGPKGTPELLKMVKNPDVTVRMRGVMEKCTYCVQRIQQAKIRRKVRAGPSPDIRVPDGTIQTACEQVCPTRAITFGDLLDPESRVSKLKDNPRDYAVLGYLNVRPRTTYLARVRNPNASPAMKSALERLGLPPVADEALGRVEYQRANYPSGFEHGHHGKEPGAHHGYSDAGEHAEPKH